MLDPGNFVRVIDNRYYPLPVGRTLTYQGVRDGVTQTDRVHVTSRTKVLEGITATSVTDVATHGRKVLEKTTDWFAQDKQGNACRFWNEVVLAALLHQRPWLDRVTQQYSPKSGHSMTGRSFIDISSSWRKVQASGAATAACRGAAWQESPSQMT